MVPEQKSKAAIAREQRAAKARSEASKRGHATRRRAAWEAAHPERFEDLASSLAGRMRADEHLPVPLGMDRDDWISRNERFARSAGPGATYRLMGWQGHDDDYVHPDQQALIEHPHTLTNPRRWEDHTPKQQQAALKAAGAHGVTMASARRAYSTQLDRSMVREDGRHQSFYSEEGADADGNMSPRTRLRASAESAGVPFHAQAAANAITSPQNKFIQKDPESGAVRYPNDESASLSVQWAKEGRQGKDYEYHPDYYVPAKDKVRKDGKLVKRDDETRAYPAQGYPKNNAKAIDVVGRMLKGQTTREAWPQSGGQEKIQPFYNAWVAPKEPEGNYLVSDVHTGGEGFAPHLSKDEQAVYLNKPGIKALHDFIARDVNRERGLVSVNRAQSSQWNQAKLEQGHNDVGVLTHSKQKRPEMGAQFQQMEGQRPLF